MKLISKILLALSCTILCLSAYSGLPTIPNHDHPTTFLGPTLGLGFTSPLTDMTAYSIAGEAGPKNLRASLTLGWKIDNSRRLKVTGEYLWQQIAYAFFSGNTRQWVHQGAIGADFQTDLAYAYNPQLDLSGYWSHAPSKTLGTVVGAYVTNAGVPMNFTELRRIAGSDAGGASPQLTVQPWQGTKVGVAANWDHVTYHNIFSPGVTAYGWGGTASIDQTLSKNVDLSISAGIRKPFNDYEGQLAWHDVRYMGRWTLGVNADYLRGKYTLPNTWNVGLSADYFFDPCLDVFTPNYKGEAVAASVPDPFLNWTADPAVHMPQVLAIADGAVTTSCGLAGPTFFGTISPPLIFGGDTVSFTTRGNFTGENLSFSLSVTPNPATNGDSITINSSTGVITVVANPADLDNVYTAIVTATNVCGSAVSTPFTITILSF